MLVFKSEKVIDPEEVIPVAAAIAPVESTWNWEVEPTDSKAEGAVVPIPTFPALVMTNLGAPDLEAVNKSPIPLLSTSMAAKEVWPEMEATGVVPLNPRTPNVANGAIVPIPTRKLEAIPVALLSP